jgi:hypothetical protein
MSQLYRLKTGQLVSEEGLNRMLDRWLANGMSYEDFVKYHLPDKPEGWEEKKEVEDGSDGV